jgi:hypothetical protein
MNCLATLCLLIEFDNIIIAQFINNWNTYDPIILGQ